MEISKGECGGRGCCSPGPGRSGILVRVARRGTIWLFFRGGLSDDCAHPGQWQDEIGYGVMRAGGEIKCMHDNQTPGCLNDMPAGWQSAVRHIRRPIRPAVLPASKRGKDTLRTLHLQRAAGSAALSTLDISARRPAVQRGRSTISDSVEPPADTQG